jgi:hypothetical protein
LLPGVSFCPQRLEGVAGHQYVVVADGQGDVHRPVLVLLGDVDAFHRHIAKADVRAELAAEHRPVELKRFLGVAGEVQYVCILVMTAFPPCVLGPAYARWSSARSNFFMPRNAA